MPAVSKGVSEERHATTGTEAQTTREGAGRVAVIFTASLLVAWHAKRFFGEGGGGYLGVSPMPPLMSAIHSYGARAEPYPERPFSCFVFRSPLSQLKTHKTATGLSRGSPLQTVDLFLHRAGETEPASALCFSSNISMIRISPDLIVA